MAEKNDKTPAAGCQIVQLVVRREAVVIVKRFKEGENTRSLARVYGLSRAGVEELIRSYGWLRNGRRPAAR